MKKRTLSILLISLLACNNTKPRPPKIPIPLSQIPGTYNGYLICKDCDSIKNTLQLNTDQSAKYSTIDPEENTFIERGIWDIVDNTLEITFQENTKQYYQVDKDIIYRLDLEKQKITQENTSFYSLNKQ